MKIELDYTSPMSIDPIGPTRSIFVLNRVVYAAMPGDPAGSLSEWM